MESSGPSRPPSSFAASRLPGSSNAFTFGAGTEIFKVQPISPTTAGQLLNGDDSSTNIIKTSETYTGTISLRSAFNAAAPANHLPAELVAKILASGAWSRWLELVSLTHICQHWRNVALATPQLWADAAQTELKIRTQFFAQTWWRTQQRFEQRFLSLLPTLLTRAAPWPLRIELSRAKCLTLLVEQGPILSPHFSRLSHLSIEAQDASDIMEVLRVVRSHIPNLEILHMSQVSRTWGSAPISIHRLSSWEDSDLPRLHTLTIPGHCFTRDIAVASLKTLVLSDGPLSHSIFLAALDRCSHTLESLTLHRWAHPERSSHAPDSTIRTVQLPNLRRLQVALHTELPLVPPPTLLFEGLSLSPSVAIEMDWHRYPGNTHQLLPKNLIGLHAPPFFDSMCLHRFGHARQMVSLHGYVGDVERLCVRERAVLHPIRQKSKRQNFGDFLDEHRYPTVTRLAFDLDIDARDPFTELSNQSDLLRRLVVALPNLRRLDLLGKNIRHANVAKLPMVKAFLSLPDSGDPPLAAVQGTAGKTLAYVCEVSEHAEGVRFADDLRGQLDELEALLAAHVAEGGRRLGKLELCMTCPSRTPGPHPPPRVYPDIRSASRSSAVLTAYLSPIYLPRFRALVDEVEFIGDVKTRGPGYRIVKRAAPQLRGPTRSTRNRGDNRTIAGSRRKGWSQS